MDRLHDICSHYIKNPEDFPQVLKGWKRVDTSIPPVTFRGVNYESLSTAEPSGMITGKDRIELSCITKKCDMEKVLLHPGLIIRKDVSGIFQETGILTTKHHLECFVERIRKKILCQSVLDTACGKILQQRLVNTDGGGYAPNSIVKVVRPATSEVCESLPKPFVLLCPVFVLPLY